LLSSLTKASFKADQAMEIAWLELVDIARNPIRRAGFGDL
jgi:hypothetical protein